MAESNLFKERNPEERMNSMKIHRRSFCDLLRIDSHDDFHNYLIDHAIQVCASLDHKSEQELGSVLAVCANHREASAFRKFPFQQILLTGIGEQSERLQEIQKTDSRISYQRQNCESISLNSRSFDLVFCKEGLHHLARPVLGLYEMLRICRKAAIIIEPYDTLLGKALEFLGLTTVYESGRAGGRTQRNNFVYRWNLRQLQFVLNSYYLQSGYHVDMTTGWMSGRYNLNRFKLIRRLSAIVGWAVSLVPGCRGNYMTAVIKPRTDIPPDPELISSLRPRNYQN